MHRYLRSIGFADNINSEYDIELILKRLRAHVWVGNSLCLP